MAKTLNQFLEGKTAASGYLKVKSPDEQKFVDKHVRVDNADRNGNGDEVFKASKIKTIDRKQGRKGYNPGEDEKVYESLESVDEVAPPGKEKMVKAIKKAYSKDGVLTAKEKAIAYATAWKAKKANEAVEELDELSEPTKDSYAKKAVKQLPGLFNKSGNDADAARKYYNRKNTVRKISNEEVEDLGEVSQKMVRAYRDKARDDKENAEDERAYYKAHNDSTSAEDQKIRKRTAGIKLAGKKIHGGAKVRMGEEIEQVDEISKPVLSRYINKAADRMSTQGVTAGLKIAADEKSSNNFKNIAKRQKGIATAVKKLAKEEFFDLLADGEIVFENEEIRAISEREVTLLATVLDKLSEENQVQFCEVAKSSSDGFDKMLSFAIQNKGE